MPIFSEDGPVRDAATALSAPVVPTCRRSQDNRHPERFAADVGSVVAAHSSQKHRQPRLPNKGFAAVPPVPAMAGNVDREGGQFLTFS
jgi:hypothetical protein